MHRPTNTALYASAARSDDNHALVRRAMLYFWREGFYASSIDDIAAETGLNRNRLYTDFGGRQGLFLAAFKRYMEEIPLAGVQRLETDVADLNSIGAYFEAQIDKAVEIGLPGMGCFIHNTVARTAPNNRVIRDVADACVGRLRAGFDNALTREAAARKLDDAPVRHLSAFLTTAALGLWIYAANTEDPDDLYKFRRVALDIIGEKLAPCADVSSLPELCGAAPLDDIGPKL